MRRRIVEEAAEQAESASESHAEAKNRLLVVDDDPGVGDFIAVVAEGLGYDVALVRTSAQLRDRLPRFDPTLVSLDLSMPEIDGIEVLSLLAEQGSRAKIILTSGLDSKLVAKAHEIGGLHGLDMLDALSKPFEVGQLEQRLTACKAKDSSPPTASDLATAIEVGDLEVYYQPKISLKPENLMAVVGAEALVRWNHATKGIIPPDQFIRLAEDSGLIQDLSAYVFREAAHCLAGVLHSHPALSISVNLSAANFGDTNLPRELEEHTTGFGVPPDQIIIEVTESTAMADVARSTEIMTRLRIKGFGLSLDDFGTGFSSLLHLYRMPFTELKVDRTFVSPLDTSEEAATITRSTIDLAHNLGLSACAEGVEDEATLESLLSYGADSAQGFLIARPMRARALSSFLENATPVFVLDSEVN